MSKRYLLRGVSAQKEDVHKATEKLDKGLFPRAFCKVYPDYLAGNEAYCNIIHSDGSGTKSLLAYLYWKETGNLNVWKGIAQDVIVMNTDDLMCAGSTGPFIYSSIINRNKYLIPGEIIQAIIQGAQEFMEKMKHHDIHIFYLGGETADLGDVVRTITVDGTMACRPLRLDIITNEKIQDGDAIVGFASYGKATYEDEYNSGIGSNGLTAARHDILHKYIARKYPEAVNPHTSAIIAYTGSKKITDEVCVIDGNTLNVGQLLLSPTRTYLPLVKEILTLYRNDIHGMIHCTGGGQTKVLHYIKKLHVIKNNLLPVPEVFQLINRESKVSWKEMYEVFNMGHRLEIYVPDHLAKRLIELSAKFEIDARIIGKVKSSDTTRLTIESEQGTFEYHATTE
jgi:phosphoribosylformylglycinamidine cyclo-ligase